jgi:hypothetical protein
LMFNCVNSTKLKESRLAGTHPASDGPEEYPNSRRMSGMKTSRRTMPNGQLEFSVNDAEVSAASDSYALMSLAVEHQAALVILPASEVSLSSSSRTQFIRKLTRPIGAGLVTARRLLVTGQRQCAPRRSFRGSVDSHTTSRIAGVAEGFVRSECKSKRLADA